MAQCQAFRKSTKQQENFLLWALPSWIRAKRVNTWSKVVNPFRKPACTAEWQPIYSAHILSSDSRIEPHRAVSVSERGTASSPFSRWRHHHHLLLTSYKVGKCFTTPILKDMGMEPHSAYNAVVNRVLVVVLFVANCLPTDKNLPLAYFWQDWHSQTGKN